jgi:hypothetical protein
MVCTEHHSVVYGLISDDVISEIPASLHASAQYFLHHMLVIYFCPYINFLIRFLAEARDFSLLHIVHTGSGAHPAFCTVGTGDCFLGVKQPERVAYHSPPSSAEVKNGGAVHPLPHTCSGHNAELIKYIAMFTIFFCIAFCTVVFNNDRTTRVLVVHGG